MAESDEAEKSLEPSPHKLEEARKKGEIARSPDMLVAVSYAGMAMVALLLGHASLTGFGAALMPLIDHPERLASSFFDGPSGGPTAVLTRSVLGAILPWMLLPGVLVLATLLATRGLLFTPSKLAFKGSRLSIIQNAKNKFGRGGLFEFAKSFVKLAVYSAALALFLAAYMSEIVGSMQAGPGPVLMLFGHLTLQFMGVVVVIAAAIGVIDYFWQRQEHLRKNRMSHKEMRDEFKNTEGDPAMKQERRQRGQEIAMNQMMADVPKASVIIVNPTHYAVALQWDRAQGGAPVCLAKGVDAVAARIREVAQDAGIPVHSDPPTARSIYAAVEIGQQIAPDHYRPVAAAIRFAEEMRTRARKRGVDMSRDFDQLAEVTQVLEDRAMQRYREVLAEETRLYAELDALSELQRTAMQDGDGAHAHRISGAEDQWRSWLAQRRLSLNQALVTLRIRKEEHQDAARLAHASQSVTADLAEEARAEEAATRRAREEEALRALTLLSGRMR